MNPKAYAAAINALQEASAQLESVQIACGSGFTSKEIWLLEAVERARKVMTKGLKEAGEKAYGDRYEYEWRAA